MLTHLLIKSRKPVQQRGLQSLRRFSEASQNPPEKKSEAQPDRQQQRRQNDKSYRRPRKQGFMDRGKQPQEHYEMAEDTKGSSKQASSRDVFDDNKEPDFEVINRKGKVNFDWQAYAQFKGDKRAEEVETLKKLDMYNKSEQLIQQIQARLQQTEDPQQQKEYLQTRLGYVNTPYADMISNNLEGFDEKQQTAYLKQLVQKEESQADSNKQAFIKDSRTLGVDAESFFVPANELDKVMRHRHRQALTFVEYEKLKLKEQMEELQTNAPYRLEPRPNSPAAQWVESENKRDITDEKTLREYYRQMVEHKSNISQEVPLREYIRDQKGIVDKELEVEQDRPTRDLPRDTNFEFQQRLAREPVFDINAANRATYMGFRETSEDMDEFKAVKAYYEMHPETANEPEIQGPYAHTLRQEHTLAKSTAHVNRNLRKKLAINLQAIQRLHQKVKIQQDATEKKIQSQYNAEVEQQALPGTKLFDFIGMNDQNLRQQEQINLEKDLEFYLNDQNQEESNKFDPASEDTEQYESELSQISKMALLTPTGDRQKTLQQYEFVFDCMRDNKIQLNSHLRARIFEYALLNGSTSLCNDILTTLSGDNTEQLSPIDPRFLSMFFEESLHQDNLDGIAHLTNYCQRYNVKTGDWKLSKFRSALGFFLNDKFDLSKVMIFVKFYRQFYADRAQSVLGGISEDLDEKQLFAVNREIFGQHEELVDMRALSSFLVEKLGSQHLMDPINKEDAVWGLIDSFTRDARFYQASQLSKNNSIEPATVAQFLGNHLNSSKALDRIFTVALRLDKCSNSVLADQFSAGILRSLRDFQATNNGNMPDSFDAQQMRDLYLRVRSRKMSPATQELLLFTLKQLRLHEEVLDMCSEHHSDIATYYMAESLLSLPIKSGTYFETIGEGIKEKSACSITQLTKAKFLDEGAASALEYFGEQAQSQVEQDKARQDLLVSLYDSLFEDKSNVSLEQFKKKYLQSSTMSAKLVKEAFAVQQMERILEDKDFDEVEQVFQLYTIMRQERMLLGEKYMLDDSEGALSGKALSALSKDQIKELRDIRERKQALEKELSQEDQKRLNHIAKIMKDEKITIFGAASNDVIDHFKSMFPEMSTEETQQIVEKSAKIVEDVEEEVIVYADPHTETLHNFDEDVDSYLEENLIMNMSQILANQEKDSEWEDEKLEYTVQKMIQHEKRAKPNYDNEYEDRLRIGEYQQHMLSDPLNEETDRGDPEWEAQIAHNVTLLDLKSQLLKAFDHRKQKALPIVLQIFNKVQDQQISTDRLADFERAHSQSQTMGDISEIEDSGKTLHQIDRILNDSRSPFYSALRDTATYADKPLYSRFEDQYPDQDSMLKPVDIDRFEQDQKKLEKINAELESVRDTLNAIQQKFVKEKLTSTTGLANEFDQWKKSSKKKTASQFDERVKALYEQFKQQNKGSKEITREEKLSIMRDTLSIEMGQHFSTDQQFPAFYATDFMQFGLSNDIPEAIQLGESLLVDKSQVSVELSMAVKRYRLANPDAHSKAFKSNPISNSTFGRHNQQGEQAFYAIDDPYWQEFNMKNSRREDIWRTPSILAWDHREYGVLGEVIDMDKVKDRLSKMVRKGY